jgi:hypothetical protein
MRSRYFLTLGLAAGFAVAVLSPAAFAQTVAPAAPAAAATGTTAPDGVFLSVAFPASVPMNVQPPEDDDRTQGAVASLSLAYLSQGAVSWQINNDCLTHTWTVTDASGAVVDSQNICPAIVQPVNKTLQAGQQANEDQTVGLHCFKYKEGQTYTLNYSYWGATGTANFTVKFVTD